MRPKMPLQDAQVRKTNFNEVALGYSEEDAKSEASRCLQCKKPLCVAGCPVAVDIPGFIDHIAKGDYTKALEVLRDTNSLPGVCGRVCPQETQCEAVCILGKKEEPIAIGRLERFAADHGAIATENTQTKDSEVAPPTGKKVAVVGSGPAGLTTAAQLAKDGHKVTLFEAFHETGGVLVYGIPEFRLPKQIVKEEVEYIESLGVDIQLNVVVGRAETVDELLGSEGYDAVFLATGAGLPSFMGIDGENLIGVYSANEFLTRVNLMKAYKFPEYDTPVKRG
ncbi:MAG: FAD-dependent oxidoreductase, partial [Methanosarcinales archaeon]|nr:FAD-dependent oxidoreductase [Methanosarcinales archaeon]